MKQTNFLSCVSRAPERGKAVCQGCWSDAQQRRLLENSCGRLVEFQRGVCEVFSTSSYRETRASCAFFFVVRQEENVEVQCDL